MSCEMHEAQLGFAWAEALMIPGRGFEEGPGAAASATAPKDSFGRSLEEDHEVGKVVDTIVERDPEERGDLVSR